MAFRIKVATSPVDREENTDRAHKADKGASSRADERKRKSRRGNAPGHNGKINGCLDGNNRSYPAGKQGFKAILCLCGGQKSKIDQKSEKAHRDDRPHEPQLFPDDRKDKIRFRKGEEKEFLSALKESDSKDPSATERQRSDRDPQHL